MATSLVVPLAYITILVTSLAIFSRVYRRRRAAEKTSFEPWFPTHPARDIYISLLSHYPSDDTPAIPDNLLKSALLVRAQADVKRIWRIRDDKIALTSLHNRGLVGDDTMARFAAAEKELEAEIVDVVQEANTFRQGWGGMIFQTATEMAHAERTREIVLNIPKLKAQEERKIALKRKYLPDAGLPQPQITQSSKTPPTTNAATVATPQKVPGGRGSPDLAEEAATKLATPGPASGTSTPSKSTPSSSKKKKNKK